jgi:hypothetical protein
MILPLAGAEIRQLSRRATTYSLQDYKPHKIKLIDHRAYSRYLRKLIHDSSACMSTLQQELSSTTQRGFANVA